MLDTNTVVDILSGPNYYDEKDLRYNAGLKYLFTKSDFEQFKSIKDTLVDQKCESFIKISLKTFDSKHIFFVEGKYLMGILEDYVTMALDDYKENERFLIERRSDDIITARIFSEIEGTLDIENVNTTHKRIKEVCENGDLKENNDIIIRNMNNAMLFVVKDSPEFNKDNLYKLYNLLSKDCLKDDDLLNGNYYRNDAVSIGKGVLDRDVGAPYEQIEELMDSLFEFVKEYKDNKDYHFWLPHICHYYILYVHPYFDYNGRTARMVSFWISWLLNIYTLPLFMSEAINENKSKYYKAIRDTRRSNNDLTYFLGYIYRTATKFSFIYKNVEKAEEKLSVSGEFLTNTERLYLKKIFIHNPTNYFNIKLFMQYVNNNITKQGAFKVLNRLAEYGLLEASENKRGEKIYKMNSEYVTYKYNY